MATEPFVASLGTFESTWYAREHGRYFLVIEVPGPSGEPVRIGFRKLGFGKFKGLEPMPIFEVADGAGWDMAAAKPIPPQPLAQALELLFTQMVTAARKAHHGRRG